MTSKASETSKTNNFDWLIGVDAELLFDEPLAPLTWYKLGGPADVLARPNSFEGLSDLLQRCHDHNTPVYALGSGANLLVNDEGVRGVVVRLDKPAFAQCEQIPGGLRVGAGYDLFALVHHAAKLGLAGLETIAGIPASLGGAIRMNAGGAFGQIGTYVQSIRVMSLEGQIKSLGRDVLSFGYRSTNIQSPFILEADLALEAGDPSALRDEVKRVFTLKKNSQPMGDKSCGCVFKNPVVSVEKPNLSDATDALKPAGMLIDQCGLKGLRVGGASVSTVHANFVVVDPGETTSQDVMNLIDEVSLKVRQQTGICLTRELVIW